MQPGSYIFTQKEDVVAFASQTFQLAPEKLMTHPDFSFLSAREKVSLGIEAIREVGHFLRTTPAIAQYKIVIIENFHFATVEAQNAFLKTFEEPPEYAYIFLVTPYIDRLLKTIVSRAQVIDGIKNKKLQATSYKLQAVLKMKIGERLLWLEGETKAIKDKSEVKQKLLEIVDAFLIQGVEALKNGNIPQEALYYLKEAKWKIEQGFPLPKLLVEGFLVKLP